MSSSSLTTTLTMMWAMDNKETRTSMLSLSSMVDLRRASVAAESEECCDLDLRRDYQNAVDCLIQCDALFKTFQEQLRSKDSQIAALEDKVIELSLELASIKAGQDHHKLKRTPQQQQQQDSSSSTNDIAKTKSSAVPHPRSERRMSWTSCWTLSSENSNSSSNHKAFNLGQFMNKTLVLLADSRHPATAVAAVAAADNSNNINSSTTIDNRVHDQGSSCKNQKNKRHSPLPHSHDDDKSSSRPWHQLERSQPQPPARQSHRSTSSEKCLEALDDIEGVVFPVSSFEVYNKGCCSYRGIDKIVTNYGAAKVDNMKNAEWPTLG